MGEATLWAALGNAVRHCGKGGSRRVFLTRLGGSAFGNSDEWITQAMQDALARFANCGLEVYVVRVGGEVAADMWALEAHYSTMVEAGETDQRAVKAARLP